MKCFDIHLRVEEAQYLLYQEKATLAGMTLSEYCRQCLDGARLSEDKSKQEVMRLLCKINCQLSMLESEQVDMLRKELSELCRCLNS